MPKQPGDDGADLVTEVAKVESPDRLFTRFARIFHAFVQIEAEIVDALEHKRERDADYRLFGAKFDSLGPLLEQVKVDATLDLVERYVLVLCATQLRDQIRDRFEDYWSERADEACKLDATLEALGVIERDLVARNDPDMERFVGWFRRRFLKRHERVVEE
jgi:hypothetical protein